MESLMGKGRKPKFDLYLKIYDLNNIPLVSGSSFIKWHLSHSMHAEHRGRTSKCPIVNHRVDYNFSKHVQHIRISVDKQNHIAECPLEIEVIQEFAMAEKITLGVIKLNLSEYIEESEVHIKDHPPGRKRANSAGVSPTSVPSEARPSEDKQDDAMEGIVRRYLMQESKINSTLKMSILMVQVDGDRSFSAPTLKSAPTFGGIAGIIAHEQQAEEEVGPTPSLSTKSRDTSEIQDLYRRTLAASWCRLPNELCADECIEDIFSGGNGWKTHQEQQHNNINNNTSTDSEGEEAGTGTLRPSDLRRLGQHSQRHHHQHHYHHGHRRANSAASDKSASTVTGRAGAAGGPKSPRLARDDRDAEGHLSRSGSVNSLNTTLAGDRSGTRGENLKFKNLREMDEAEVREDMIAWRLPSGVAA